MPLSLAQPTNTPAEPSAPAPRVLVPPPAPESLTNDIRGIKPPVPVSSSWPLLGWVLGLAVLLAAYLAWRRLRRRAVVPPPRPAAVPPHEIARQKLREALELIDQPQPFCVAVSAAIRVYLEERFRFHAPERTTEEFLEELQNSALLSFDQKQLLGEFLMRCDLVKFARYEPRRPELEDLYETALRLVQETEPPPLAPATVHEPSEARPSS